LSVLRVLRQVDVSTLTRRVLQPNLLPNSLPLLHVAAQRTAIVVLQEAVALEEEETETIDVVVDAIGDVAGDVRKTKSI